MNDYSFIRPMLYFGLPLVNGEARKDLRRENYTTGDAAVHWYENSTRLEANWRPNNDWTVRNIGSFIYADRLWRMGPNQFNYQPATNDIRREGFGLFEQGQFQFNNQVEATYVKPLFGMANALAIGGDVERLYYTRYVNQWPGRFSVVPLRVTDPGRYPTDGIVTTQAQNTDVFRTAQFVDDRLKVTSRLALIGGFRFDSQHVNRLDLAAARGSTVKRTYNVFNWRAGAVYEIFAKTNLYAQFSRATDAVANIGVVSAAQLLLNPTRGRQFEAGVKQSLQNGRIDWTLLYYRIVKRDLLVPDVFSIATLVQVGSQSSRGVEGTFSVDAGRGMNFGVNWTVLDPQYDEFFEVVSGVRTNRQGNRPPAVSSTSGNAFTTFQIRRRWLAQASLRYVGQRYTSATNTQAIPRYATVDGGVRWSLTERTAIDFRGVNLFDAFYANNFEGNGRGGGGWLLGAPRSVEIAFTARF
jgi:iron complex outermembrane recepter protein